jgi:hypothetical protein
MLLARTRGGLVGKGEPGEGGSSSERDEKGKGD